MYIYKEIFFGKSVYIYIYIYIYIYTYALLLKKLYIYTRGKESFNEGSRDYEMGLEEKYHIMNFPDLNK